MSAKPFAVVTDQAELRRALAARRKQLGFSQLAMDDRAGFPGGYTAKLEAGVRGFGQMSLGTLLSALNLTIMLSPAEHRGIALQPVETAQPNLEPDLYRKRGRLGAAIRMLKVPHRQRRRIAKKAATMRWERVRAQKAAEKRAVKREGKKAAGEIVAQACSSASRPVGSFTP